MANKKISDLSDAAAIAGSELIEIVQSGGNFKVTPAALLAYFGAGSIDKVSASTSGGTITLDFNNKAERVFYGSASFSSGKTVAIANATNALKFSFSFNVTAVVGITLPNNFYMADPGLFSAHVWTPFTTGIYLMTGVNDGSGNFLIEIRGPQSNT